MAKGGGGEGETGYNEAVRARLGAGTTFLRSLTLYSCNLTLYSCNLTLLKCNTVAILYSAITILQSPIALYNYNALPSSLNVHLTVSHLLHFQTPCSRSKSECWPQNILAQIEIVQFQVFQILKLALFHFHSNQIVCTKKL